MHEHGTSALNLNPSVAESDRPAPRRLLYDPQAVPRLTGDQIAVIEDSICALTDSEDMQMAASEGLAGYDIDPEVLAKGYLVVDVVGLDGIVRRQAIVVDPADFGTVIRDAELIGRAPRQVGGRAYEAAILLQDQDKVTQPGRFAAMYTDGLVGLPRVEDIALPSPEKSSDLEQFSERTRLLAEPLGKYVDGSSTGDPSGRDDGSMEGRFAALLNPDVEPEFVDVSAAAVRVNPRDVVRPEMVEDAGRTLDIAESKDSQLKSIIQRYAVSNPTMSTVDLLRSGHMLRCEIIDHFTRKISMIRMAQPDSLPERVRRDDATNNKKNPNSDGYERIGKVSSTECVALLALAMLDASFDAKRADTTRSHTRHDGTAGVGQHRDAAKLLLGLL